MSHITKYGPFEKEFLNRRGMLLTGDELHGFDTEFKFGHNSEIGTSFGVISEGGLCRLPAPANATTLRVKAGGNANDVNGGSGAQMILLSGIDETGQSIQEAIVLAGASASASTTQKFMRLWRALVINTGVYPETPTAAGQAATITIENTAGTEDWLLIRFNGFADCQSQTICFHSAAGQRIYLTGVSIFVDTNKVVDVLLIFRNNFMNTTTITPWRVGSELNGIEGYVHIPFTEPPRFPEFTDVALLAKVSTGTAAVSAQMNWTISSIAPAS